MKLSIVIPFLEKGNSILDICKKISEELLNEKKLNYEIIIVNNNNYDYEDLKRIYNDDMKHVRIVSLSRSYCVDICELAGINESKGIITCIVYSDKGINVIKDSLNELEKDNSLDYISYSLKNINKSNNKYSKIFKKYSNFSFNTDYVVMRMFKQNLKTTLLFYSTKYNDMNNLYNYVGFNQKNNYLDHTYDKKISFNYFIKSIFNYTKLPILCTLRLGIINLVLSLIPLIVFFVKLFNIGLDASIVYLVLSIIFILSGITWIIISFIGNFLIYNIRMNTDYSICYKKGLEDSII